MNISIFGLGYVGVVTSACLSSRGHKIVGVDVNKLKVDLLNEGISPIVEKDVGELLKEAKLNNLLTATMDINSAIENTEVSIVCVGTPSRANGSLNTAYLENVCKRIGDALRLKRASHIIIFRSTMLPGTMRELIIPTLELSSGKIQNKDFFVAFNPEFLRESSAVYDFNNPPKTVVGVDSDEVGDEVFKLYEGLPGPMIKNSIEIAEMVKYIDNNFHALKITFANEIGQICKKLGLDSHVAMGIFVQDQKLNISSAYFKPGFAFGGSCLPKDLRAINYLTKMLDLETPLLGSLLHSNSNQILTTIKKIMSFGKRKIGVAGFSFKEGTDDLRESPMIEVIETLLGKGYDLKLYDKNVSIAKLIGANKEYIANHIPHISSIMVDSIEELLEDRELIIIGNKDPEFIRILREIKRDQIIFDLIRIGEIPDECELYEGICW